MTTAPGAAEAEIQAFNSVGIYVLGYGGRGVGGSALGQHVHLVEHAERVDGPEQQTKDHCPLMLGMVTWRNSLHLLAPSILAAS